MNTKYNITLTALSPLFIGTGREIPPTDYLVKGENFFHIPFQDVLNILSDEDRKQILENSNDPLKMRRIFLQYSDQTNLVSKIQEKTIYIAKISDYFEKNYKKHKYEEIQNNESNKLHVHEFCGDSFGNKYIAGSSLKGAIRTALLNERIEKLGKFNDKKIDKINEKDFLTTQEANTIMIRDCFLKKFENHEKGKDYSDILTVSEFTRSANGFYEYIPKDQVVTGEMILKNNSITKKEIITSCNKFYKEVLDFLIHGFENYNEKLKKINNTHSQNKRYKNDNLITAFKDIQLEPVKDNECLLNIGFGGGKLLKQFIKAKRRGVFKTKKDKNPIKESEVPFTTWLVDNLPLGWVKSTFEETS